MIAEGEMDLKRLEEIFSEKSRELAGQLMVQAFEKLDAQLAENRDKQRYELKDIRTRRITTLVGEVDLRRRYYHDQQEHCSVALLDQKLNLDKDVRLSPHLQDVAAQLATEMSYGKATAILQGLFKQNLSRQSVWQAVQRMGSALESQDQVARNDVFEKGKSIRHPNRKPACLFGEADGCFISLQRERSRKLELKVGAWYEGWQKKSVKRPEYELIGKHYVATPANAQVFWEQMTVAAERRYGLSNILEIYAGGDGAAWIKAGAAWIGASRIKLDTFHVHRLLGRAFGFSKEISQAVGQLLNGKHEEAQKALAKLAVEEEDPKRREKQADAMAWVMENQKHLKRIDFQGASHANVIKRQMGTMERQVDLVVAERFKKRGMSWSPQGAGNLLTLRVRKLNGEWPSDWSRPEAEQVEINKLPRKKQGRPLPVRQGGMPVLDSPTPTGKLLKHLVATKNWVKG